jgi:hypothetical protein
MSHLMKNCIHNLLITKDLKYLAVCVIRYCIPMAITSLNTALSHTFSLVTSMLATSVSTMSPTKPTFLAMWSLMRLISQSWTMLHHYYLPTWLLQVTLLYPSLCLLPPSLMITLFLVL